MSDTEVFYICVAFFGLIMACNIVALARHYRALHMAWIAIKSMEAHNNMMFEFLEAERERTRAGPSPAGHQRDTPPPRGGRPRHVDGL